MDDRARPDIGTVSPFASSAPISDRPFVVATLFPRPECRRSEDYPQAQPSPKRGDVVTSLPTEPADPAAGIATTPARSGDAAPAGALDSRAGPRRLAGLGRVGLLYLVVSLLRSDAAGLRATGALVATLWGLVLLARSLRRARVTRSQSSSPARRR